MILGALALKLSVLAAAIALVSAFRWARGVRSAERTFRLAYHAMTAGLVVASIHLLVAILRHDFRFEYVIGYTSRDLPTLYLLSAFWAGQSGTFLLWALFAALIGYALSRPSAFQPAATMSAYLPTVGLLLGLMLVPSGDPFRLAPSVPPDGRGLNPLLQDPWMASHPPLVFLGYAALAAPFALALASIVRRREQDWLRPCAIWSLVSFVSLGAGIILGGIWAYRVLGWGGYWGWDPVENASLVPWLAVTALLHAVVTQRAMRALPKTSFALALAGYALVLYATFLTRSGVLADVSVHSFPAGDIHRILVAVLALVVAVTLVALVRARRTSGIAVPFELSWPLALSTGVIALGLCGTIVIVGTSWPILSGLVGKLGSPTAGFYNAATAPIAVALLALLSLAPLLAWAKRPLRHLARPLVTVCGIAALGTALAAWAGGRGVWPLVVLYVAIAATAANLWRLVEIARAGFWRTGAAVAHVGFAVMLAGVVGSSAWGVGQRIALPLGTPVEALGRTLTFRGHVEGSEPQDRWAVEVREANGRIQTTELAVFRAFVGGNAQEFHRPGILRGALADLYVAPTALDTTGEPVTLQLERDAEQRLGTLGLTFRGFESHVPTGGGMRVEAHVDLALADGVRSITLPLGVVDGRLAPTPVEVAELGGAQLTLERMSVEQGWVQVRFEPTGTPTQVLAVDVSTKPLVSLVWIGSFAMLLGCAIAAGRHVREPIAIAAHARATSNKRSALAVPARTTAG
jgi:cytochrome c-type biogenesis protein CcmF